MHESASHKAGPAPGPSPDWYMPPEGAPAAWLPPGERATDLDLAGFGRRVAARLIDQAVVMTIIFAVVFGALALASEENIYGETEIPLPVGVSLALFGFTWFYLCEALQLAFWGRTLGKCLLKTRVADVDAPDEPLMPFRGMGRAACYPFLWTLIGSVIGIFALVNLLWTLWDRPHRRCLHDKMARTIVVRDRHPARRAPQILVMGGLATVLAVASITLSAVTG
ncbi:hypothetical protein BJF79_11595 [Actinomadura sp. CNU-125]|uniref:RDD family protein n=1 Tax=Actinomadura sp. CNU-125 TaxID=1904961 RepID=UPI000965D336|nr:RDD family protein [Actinomadura sp. CNU-125]OLT27512.1 hypothetical protein BJF79_11595 [Actinomadura sp. CNU-125]